MCDFELIPFVICSLITFLSQASLWKSCFLILLIIQFIFSQIICHRSWHNSVLKSIKMDSRKKFLTENNPGIHWREKNYQTHRIRKCFLTILSSDVSILNRLIPSFITSASFRSGLSVKMFALFSSSHIWKPVFGLKQAHKNCLVKQIIGKAHPPKNNISEQPLSGCFCSQKTSQGSSLLSPTAGCSHNMLTRQD